MKRSKTTFLVSTHLSLEQTEEQCLVDVVNAREIAAAVDAARESARAARTLRERRTLATVMPRITVAARRASATVTGVMLALAASILTLRSKLQDLLPKADEIHIFS